MKCKQTENQVNLNMVITEKNRPKGGKLTLTDLKFSLKTGKKEHCKKWNK